MEWLIIPWLFCAIVSAVLASNKGRSGAGWFFLGLIVGPFGFIVAALPPIKKDAQNTESDALRKCPFCAEMIKPDAIKCRFCGSEVPPVEVKVEPEPDKPEIKGVKCPRCNYVYTEKYSMKDGWYCPNCRTTRY